MKIQYISISVLVVLWMTFFLWPHMQRRLAGGRRNSIGDFTKKVTVISKVAGHRSSRSARGIAPLPTPTAAHVVTLNPTLPPTATLAATGLPMSPDARRRRRDALVILAVGSLGSLLLAVVAASVLMWIVHVVADLLLVGFVGLLVHLRRRADERRAKVHFLPQHSMPSPALVLRRTASS